MKAGSQRLALVWPSTLSAQRPLPPPPCRLQHKLALLQQQCAEKQQLFQTLQSELQIYEALHGSSKKGPKGMRSPSHPLTMSFLPLLRIPVGSSSRWSVQVLESYSLSQKSHQPRPGAPSPNRGALIRKARMLVTIVSSSLDTLKKRPQSQTSPPSRPEASSSRSRYTMIVCKCTEPSRWCHHLKRS